MFINEPFHYTVLNNNHIRVEHPFLAFVKINFIEEKYNTCRKKNLKANANMKIKILKYKKISYDFKVAEI